MWQIVFDHDYLAAIEICAVVKKLKFSAINKFDILFYFHKNS